MFECTAQTIYFLAKQKRPLSDFKAQLELLDLLKTPGLDLNSAFPSNVSYDSSTFVTEAVQVIEDDLIDISNLSVHSRSFPTTYGNSSSLSSTSHRRCHSTSTRAPTSRTFRAW